MHWMEDITALLPGPKLVYISETSLSKRSVTSAVLYLSNPSAFMYALVHSAAADQQRVA